MKILNKFVGTDKLSASRRQLPDAFNLSVPN